MIQSRRNAKAAKRFFRKLLRGLQYVPRVLIMDKLWSYAAAKREILPGVKHRRSRYLNNRAGVSQSSDRRVARFTPRLPDVVNLTMPFQQLAIRPGIS